MVADTSYTMYNIYNVSIDESFFSHSKIEKQLREKNNPVFSLKSPNNSI